MSLIARYVTKRFGDVTAFEKVILVVEPGQVLGLAGCCGCGKSTLATVLCGLLPFDEGSVELDGIVASGKLASLDYRRNVAFVQQHPERQFFAQNAFDEVAFGPRNLGLEGDELEACVSNALELVGLEVEEGRHRSPLQYSGGQQRRLSLACALAANTPYIVLDEPSAGLDQREVSRLKKIIVSLREQGKGVLLISHDMDLLLECADQVALMARGSVICCDEAQFVLSSVSLMEQAGLVPPQALQLRSMLEALSSQGSELATRALELLEVRGEGSA